MEFQIDPAQFLPNIDQWLIGINYFFELTFSYLKYIFFVILLVIGILTLISLRGRYFLERLRYSQEQKLADNPITKPRLIIGTIYIIIAFGILFNWFTYLLIISLNPLPDRFVFNFIEFTDIFDPYGLNRISDINMAQFEFEKTLYYLISIGSFASLLNIIISIWLLVNKGGKDAKKSIIMLIGGIIGGILTGFTTCLPLFL
ncbi:MAG: hypothetical protein EAX89_02115 [Candidatus Lokiarchaeota archaeon]|nr:hypothetical protein [Candidatus Lokiarchaeota archaeon]